MALTATLHRFELSLADIDRNVYDELQLRVACHPSEDHARMVIRVLARALAHEEGLEFGRGLSNTDEPALWTVALGAIKTWIDVGAPSAERLHRASKKADRVLVFTDKVESSLRREWKKREIHQAESIALLQLPSEFVASLVSHVARANKWYLTVHEGALTVTIGDESYETPRSSTT